MRKLIVTNIMSLDGYYEGPGNDVTALFMALPGDRSDLSFDEHNAERLRAADKLLLGRKSFEGFKSYWPPIADDPAARRCIERSHASTTRSTRSSSRTR